MRKLFASLSLALVLLVGAASGAGASPKHASGVDCTNFHMVQGATQSNVHSTADGDINMDVWVAEKYTNAGNIPCAIFQAVARIGDVKFGSHGEPIGMYNITLEGNNGYLGGYTWSGLGWTPGYANGFWYDYGPYVQGACDGGYVYAQVELRESPNHTENDLGLLTQSDSDYGLAISPNQSNC